MPQTVHHVGPMLDRYLQAAEIYRGEIQASDGSIAIVFGSQRMLERLNEAVELFVDATFQVKSYFYDILKIFIITMN